MSTVSFTVVIPAYNYAHCLPRAIRSVLAQDYPHCQLLVINDGSTDNTDAVVQGLKAEGLNFDYIAQDNAGLSAVRNRGVDEARHDWLVFLDADDEMLPGALAAMAGAVTDSPQARLLVAGHESAFPDGRIKTVRPAAPAGDQLANMKDYLFKRLSICNGACAMHRDVFARIRYRPEMRHTEDLPVFAHVLAWYPLATCEYPVARIHKHADSMRHDVAAAQQIGLALEKIIFEDSGLPEGAARLRRAYRGRRAISLMKLSHAARDYPAVRQYFRQALRDAPLQALSPRYLRRYLSALVAS